MINIKKFFITSLAYIITINDFVFLQRMGWIKVIPTTATKKL